MDLKLVLSGLVMEVSHYEAAYTAAKRGVIEPEQEKYFDGLIEGTKTVRQMVQKLIAGIGEGAANG